MNYEKNEQYYLSSIRDIVIINKVFLSDDQVWLNLATKRKKLGNGMDK